MIKNSLKNISEIINSGLTPLRSNQDYWLNGNIPWVKTEQLGEKYIYDSNEKITKHALENTSIKLNPANTLSIAMYGEGKTRGSVSILKNETTTNQACCNIVIDKNKADFEFVYYNLKTQYDNLRNLSSGVRKNLNSNDIKNFEIYLPNIETQKKIAKVLSDLDAKIEVNNKMNHELEAMAKSLYDYWFVQFDFPDENGKPYRSSGGKMVYNEVLKLEIPEGWEVTELGDISQIKRGKLVTAKTADLEGKYKVISAGINYSYLHSESNRKKNTITVSGSGANAGFINFWREPIFANDCTTVRGKTDEETLVVLQFLKLRQDYILNQARGSAQPHVYPKDLSVLKIIIPNNNLFDIYGKKILPSNKLISNNLKQNQNLAELRDWLLPMLMNGQVRIAHSQADGNLGEVEQGLGMVAEPGVAYEKDKESIDSLFDAINYDYEVAVVVLLTRQRMERTYGKKYIHKMFSNIKFLEDLPVFEDLKFQENHWGMYCPTLTKTIDNQKFIYFEGVNDEVSVINFKYKHIKEVSDWMKQDDYNKNFVNQVNNMLSIYEKPLINKNMDRIELLNTVLECMNVLETDNFDAIWNKMERWKMQEDNYKTKAEKFKPEETRMMIDLIKEIN